MSTRYFQAAAAAVFIALIASCAAAPGDCAIVATEAYHRVAVAASWARLLHIDYETRGLNSQATTLPRGHMLCAWQVAPNDPILIYDSYFLKGSTLELSTSKRDAKTLADALSDFLSRPNYQSRADARCIKITEAHFVE